MRLLGLDLPGFVCGVAQPERGIFIVQVSTFYIIYADLSGASIHRRIDPYATPPAWFPRVLFFAPQHVLPFMSSPCASSVSLCNFFFA